MLAGREIEGREGRVNEKAVKKDGSENMVTLCVWEGRNSNRVD